MEHCEIKDATDKVNLYLGTPKMESVLVVQPTLQV